ncbi:ADP-ribosylglycohydrolase family protein [Halomonas vilamensis]|uniref:ADP-ribosylglycohydrolase family protein n=1 Tax=Vreelandella vilamensis TaxID=531309 RepID=A0ABU1H7Z6_9GAMM|nr:ADP-ribosylglycohydrolase family protein [Halomonas vilamensis]MDR5900424.1 ADP-ribosylglycohydrolase family protein [Halomonas vilamensis]
MPKISHVAITPLNDDARLNRYRGALLGLAVGDALGTTLEFCARDRFPLHTEMLGGGAFHVAPGEWTDDTAMALCLADSLLTCQGFDPHDQLTRYVRWWREGYMACQGRCIDIGMATQEALRRFERTQDVNAGSTEVNRSGNGGIMRLAPAVMVAQSEAQAIMFAIESSHTTHASPDCLDAAALFGSLLWRLLQGEPLRQVLVNIPALPARSDSILAIQAGLFRELPREEISSSGYVIDTLEAALWCCWQAPSLEAALILAANLGDDADTVATVTGQLARAAWGADQIPARWMDKLA